MLIRKSIHTIESVYNAVKDVYTFERARKKEARIDFEGDNIKGNSQRYQTFFIKGMTCVECGVQGQYFAKEKHLNDEYYHLNLYGIDQNGEEVLMTKDHIIPKSKGGDNHISNYQCMCTKCNQMKGNHIYEK